MNDSKLPTPLQIYISLPITGYDIEDVKAKAASACAVIKDKGHIPINPLDSNEDGMDYADYMRKDLALLLKADAALFLDGWFSSRGCQLEYMTTALCGIRRFFNYEEIPQML